MNLSKSLDELPDVLTVDEVASVLRVARSSVYESVRDGSIPALHIRRRVVIPKQAVSRLLEAALQPPERSGE